MCADVWAAHMYLHHVHVRCPWRPRKTSDPLEWESEVDVCHHVGVGNETQLSARASTTLNY